MKTREVKPLEIGKKLKFLADGIFGYVYAHQIASRFRNPLEIEFNKRQLSEGEARFFFKVEKISENQVSFIGYVSDESELILGNWQNIFGKEVILLPLPYKEFRNLAKIKFDKNLHIQDRGIEQDDGRPMTILEVRRIQINKESSTKGKTDVINLRKRFLAYLRTPQGIVAIVLVIIALISMIVQALSK